jgi:hypothetical protein
MSYMARPDAHGAFESFLQDAASLALASKAIEPQNKLSCRSVFQPSR